LPLSKILILCKLGRNQRLVALCEWLTDLPARGSLPQTAHLNAIISSQFKLEFIYCNHFLKKMQELNPLEKNVQYLKGVGPKRAKLFKKLGIETINDLLTYYPREWEDRSKLKAIATTRPGEKALICGKIKFYDILWTHSNLRIFKVAVSDKSGIIYALWFKKGSYRYDVFAGLKKQLKIGEDIYLYGTIVLQRYNKQGHKEIHVEEYATKNSIHLRRIVPFYSLTEGIDEKFFRNLIRTCLETYLPYTIDILPDDLRSTYHLLPYQEALSSIHFPRNFGVKEQAYRRLVFEEFLLFQLALALKRQKVKKTLKPHTYHLKRFLLTPFRQSLGFEFTKAQKKTINEIFQDMQSKYPMNRLLQGDVGSGKTVVALSAMLLAIENGCQAVFMAPTEILAEQHYLTFKQFLSPLRGIEYALLTGKTKKSERIKILERLKRGEISILIGTHALIEEKIIFKKLTLVVIDEQHRFGVIQRAQLRAKGSNPDVLVLTATPIPRSLALTLYGDLDISLLDELPPGRQEIVTLHLSDMQAYEFVKKEVFSEHQAYIVYPLIEESDKLELKAAVAEAKRLKQEVFPNYRVGLIHGQLKGQEKEKIMHDFREKRYDILIATTVIEVGIDIPNATIMVIEHADRFGLATLHQLRGRVGRGFSHPLLKGKDRAYCILLGEPKTEEAKRRIQIMLSTTNGFRIAEEDLKIRGPGEFFGTTQHGLPEFRIGNPLNDYTLLQEARKVAFNLFQQNRFYDQEYQQLRNFLYRKFASRLGLVRIG